MLTNLHVKNLALIEEADIEFTEGFNIMTGETGAGKSIILGSINAALGDKTSPDFIRTGCEYGLAEASFYVENKEIIEALQELGLEDNEGQVIISRKIMPSRSQFKINGQMFTAAQTRQIASLLIDIHGQHDNRLLIDEGNQLNVIDQYGSKDIEPLLIQMKKLYNELQKAAKEYESMICDEQARKKEISFTEYEVNEIESAALKSGEDEELQEAYQRMSNYQKIIEEVSGADMLLNSGDNNLNEMAGAVIRSLTSAAAYDDSLNQVCDIMNDVESLIYDAGHSIKKYMEECSFDPEEFMEVQERLDLINTLKMKYADTIEGILEYCDNKKQKLEELYNFDEVYIQKKQFYESKLKEAKECADSLSVIRKKMAAELSQKFIDSLKNLNFLDVRFEIKFKMSDKIMSKGQDVVEFMISTNPGEDMKPLAKIASGGELSRIMLAIKSVTASVDEEKTFIFDEIDAGISGRTAQMVANEMCNLSKKHQIICITHLPQIASMADTHFLIEKSTKDSRTVSNIDRLSYDESVKELARMLGGSMITDAVVSNAKEMKKMADDFKHNN